MNETLCRALIQARLTEEDVAAGLQVDPKTVRRWLEGRVPYLRHRWVIAAMVGADETDLWPQLRAARARPDEVIAIYPHRDTVPREVWLRMFGSAQHQIGILDEADSPLGADRPIFAALAKQARSGITIRVCMRVPDEGAAGQGFDPQSGGGFTASVRDSVATYTPLREEGDVEVRLCQGTVYNSVYYADDQLLVTQRLYGVPVRSAPTLHLERVEGNDIAAAYYDAFAIAWAAATFAE